MVSDIKNDLHRARVKVTILAFKEGFKRENIEQYHKMSTAHPLFGGNFIMQQNDDSKHTANTTDGFIGGKSGRFYTGQVNHLNSIKHAIHLLYENL